MVCWVLQWQLPGKSPWEFLTFVVIVGRKSNSKTNHLSFTEKQYREGIRLWCIFMVALFYFIFQIVSTLIPNSRIQSKMRSRGSRGLEASIRLLYLYCCSRSHDGTSDHETQIPPFMWPLVDYQESRLTEPSSEPRTYSTKVKWLRDHVVIEEGVPNKLLLLGAQLSRGKV